MLKSIMRWLDENLPVFCADCKNLTRKKNASYHYALIGRVVPLCKKCEDRWFGGEA